MANGLLLQYVNKRKNDYKHFMGVSSLPSFELISKHISLSDANASGWGAWATHRFDFQSQSHSIEVWEDLWKPQLHGDYVIFHELTHLLDTENLVNGDKKKNAIPIPPIEKQKEIADKYKTVKDEITMLQLKLEKAKNRMAHIIEEGGI